MFPELRGPITAPSSQPPIDVSANTTRAESEASLIAIGLPNGQVYQTNVPLQDIQAHRFAGAIQTLYQAKVISVSADGHFNPDQPLTRGEAWLWLYNIANNNAAKEKAELNRYNRYRPIATTINPRCPIAEPGTEAEPSALEPLPKSHYFKPLQTLLLQTGHVKGYEGLLRSPDEPIRREELATLLWLLSDRTPSSPKAIFEQVRLQDSSQIQTAYQPGMAFLLTQGKGRVFTRTFSELPGRSQSLASEPQKPVSRAQAAALLDTLQPLIGKAPRETGMNETPKAL